MTEEKTADIGELAHRVRMTPRPDIAFREEVAITLTALEACCAELAEQTVKLENVISQQSSELATLRDRIGREPVVKALEWKRPPVSEFLQRSYTEIGTYRSWTHHEADGQWFWEYASLIGGKIMNGQGASEAEVQAAAQADYERRILSALATAPERVEVNKSLPERLWLGAGNDDNEHSVWFDPDEGGTLYVRADLASPPAPVVTALEGKYGDVLRPFVAMMEAELDANSGKGDRPGWLEMDRKTALLEIFYHLAKLQKATKDDDQSGIREYGADVANMAMMLVDICGSLDAEPALASREAT